MSKIIGSRELHGPIALGECLGFFKRGLPDLGVKITVELKKRICDHVESADSGSGPEIWCAGKRHLTRIWRMECWGQRRV